MIHTPKHADHTFHSPSRSYAVLSKDGHQAISLSCRTAITLFYEENCTIAMYIDV